MSSCGVPCGAVLKFSQRPSNLQGHEAPAARSSVLALTAAFLDKDALTCSRTSWRMRSWAASIADAGMHIPVRVGGRSRNKRVHPVADTCFNG
jgi:hypothetical protein